MSTSTTDNTPNSSGSNSTHSFTTEAQNLEDLPLESLEDITLVKLLSRARSPVFLVHSSSKNHDFALKIFNLEGDKPSKYFKNESRFIEIYHPNVIALYHVEDQIPFSFSDHEAMVSCTLMEYAPYGDLSKFMRKLGENFTEKLARTYFRQLIEGLEYLHSSDICHLDLKLENLLIGEDGQLKIADFDLSYVKGDSHILSRGTKYYRAPELKALKKNVNKRADIYSAGVLLFVLKCFGVLPHTEDKLYRRYDLQNLLKTEPEEFFKAHSIIQEKDSSFFDDDFKDLFIAMTKENPEERMKLRRVKQSKWYRGPVYSRKELKQKVAQIFNQ